MEANNTSSTPKKGTPEKKNDFDVQRRRIDRLFHILFPIVRFFFYLVHPCKVSGRENIPEGGALVCPNHTSLNDPLIAMFALGGERPPRAMAKQELLDVPVLGKILGKVGVFGIRRGQADTKAIMTAIRYLKAGDRLIMFPEGTRVEEGEDLEAKNGVAMLALRTKVPILPVYIPPKKPWFRFTRVVIGEPFLPQCQSKRPTAQDYAAIGKEWKRRINELEGKVNG